jgi:hypothetical protein
MTTNGHVEEGLEGGESAAALVPMGNGEIKGDGAPQEGAVTSIQAVARRGRSDGVAATKTRLTAAELDRARREIIEKQLPPGLSAEVVAILYKLLPDEILVIKKMMELVYAQAAAKAGEEGFKQGAETAGREGFERGKAAMLKHFKLLIDVANAADAWVENRPRMSTTKLNTLENAEAAQAATVALVESVVEFRQMRAAGEGSGSGSE